MRSLLLFSIIYYLTPAISDSFHFPEYCGKIDNGFFLQRRTIPKIAHNSGIQLTQVLTISRHGARAPISNPPCWPKYSAKWDCDVTEEIRGHANTPQNHGKLKRQLQLIPFANLAQRDVKLHDKNVPVSQNLSSLLSFNVDHNQNDNLPNMQDGHKSDQSAVEHAGVFGPAVQEPQTSSAFQDSFIFRKIYDEMDRGSILGGTCGLGHLLYEGVLQHQILGSVLASNYRTLIDPDHIEDQIYVRASDFQRTVLSASTQVTSYLKESFGRSYSKRIDDSRLLLHTRDLRLESLFPNMASCRALSGLRERVVASNEYQALEKSYLSLKQRLQQALELPDLPQDITGNVYDCLMTTICSNQIPALPPGIRPFATYSSEDANGNVIQKSLLDETFEAVDTISNFEYTWDKGKFSQVAMVRFMCDFKAKILVGLRAELSRFYRGSDMMNQLKSVCKCNPQEFLEYGEEKEQTDIDKTERLVFFVGHDTTIIPFLASLGAFDGKWPPYASQIVMEISKLRKGEFYFRLIYNGKLLNNKIKGCDIVDTTSVVDQSLCEISKFFEATWWATPSNAVAYCQG